MPNSPFEIALIQELIRRKRIHLQIVPVHKQRGVSCGERHAA
jgi:hypothetical protein